MVTIFDYPIFDKVSIEIFTNIKNFNYSSLLYRRLKYQTTTIHRAISLFKQYNLITSIKENRKNILIYTDKGLKLLITLEQLNKELEV